MEIIEVVTVFLKRDSKILIVKRSGEVRTFKGRWSAISGYLESEPIDQAITEVKEETGIIDNDIILKLSGNPIDIRDPDKELLTWRVYPFLFEITSASEIKLDWENKEEKWIKPEQLTCFNTVPGLQEAWEEAVNGKEIL